ncbi:MAG TPA: SseB family protein [Streptosporangiaceae bacterium]
MLGISGGDPAFRDDQGAADPAVTAALDAFAAGLGSETEVLAAIARGRLLVPVVAVLAEQMSSEDQPGPDGAAAAGAGDGAGRGAGIGGGEKASEMAMPTLIGLDGRRAIPAFTCLDSMRRWQPDARPVPVAARHVWQAAEADSCAVVIDVGGPVPFAVEGARLTALARGEAPPPPYADPDVHEVVSTVLAGQLDVAAFELRPPETGADRDLEIALTLAPGSAGRDVTELATGIGNAVMARLGGRLRRGVAIWLGGHSGPGGAGPR